MKSILVNQVRFLKNTQLNSKYKYQQTKLIRRFCTPDDNNPGPSQPDIITSTKKRRGDRISKSDSENQTQNQNGSDPVRDATSTQRATPKPDEIVEAAYREKTEESQSFEDDDSDELDVQELEQELGIEDQDKEMFRGVMNMDNEQVEFMNTLSLEDIEILNKQLRDKKLLERSENILLDLLVSGAKIEDRINLYNQKGEINAALLGVLFKRIQAAEALNEDQEIIDALIGLFRRLRAVFERNRSSAALRLLDDLLSISDELGGDAVAANEAVKSRMQIAFSGQQGNLGIMELAKKLSEQLPEEALENSQKIEDFLPETEFVPKEQFIEEVEGLIAQAEVGRENMEEQFSYISSKLKEFEELSKKEGYEITNEERNTRQNLRTSERELQIQIDYKKTAILQVQQILSQAQEL